MPVQILDMIISWIGHPFKIISEFLTEWNFERLQNVHPGKVDMRDYFCDLSARFTKLLCKLVTIMAKRIDIPK